MGAFLTILANLMTDALSFLLFAFCPYFFMFNSRKALSACPIYPSQDLPTFVLLSG
jgi:hypothetical protein